MLKFKLFFNRIIQKVKSFSPSQLYLVLFMGLASGSASAADFDPATVIKTAFDTLTAQVGEMLQNGWGVCITLTVGLLLMRLFKRVTSQAA
ncbi:TPA: hypothetical protein G8N95_004737 [Salmonella enterica]|uniref:Uncharacterized protein n=1 Tax=Salmonella enterica TaxID=28901 RepID=A0A750EF35_SALER|nr:hypothetical protein [Salmonella enterica subsp. enterica serovar Potsdam]EAY7468917.1 hypothetical protein [Salmonella enterica]EBR0172635.1 hypothetical protein [Salmonella enterica subsp. enterica serovar Mikawasima]EBX6498323.1 hypothetical protein [Salmonella enterica subsp. enterica serovar Abony]EDV4904267.1 hypothetical protein [Salmonella enterica subsp. enterica]